MRSATVIVLCTLVVQGFAKDAMDTLSDKLIDRLVDRVTKMPIDFDNLDQTTLAKTHADSALGKALSSVSVPRLPTTLGGSPTQVVTPVSVVQDTLRSYGFPPSPMEKIALTAIAATRDVSMAAQIKPIFESMDSKSKKEVIAMTSEIASVAEIEGMDLKLEDLAGGTAPMGKGWDPVGFTTNLGAGKLLYYREAELKHGRVGMLATLGFAIGEKYHPFYGSLGENMPATKLLDVPELQTFFGVLFHSLGALEVFQFLYGTDGGPFVQFGMKQGWTLETGKVPGDYGFDPLGLKPADTSPGNQEWKELQNKEINNGRLAMLAAAGILAQEMVTGQKIFALEGP